MNGAERRACIIGWPAAHSRSPIIHNYWIAQHGLQGEYRREAVTPEAFPDFIRTLSEHGYAGANVTMPHKEAAFAAAETDAIARATGSVNTLWLDGGRLRGTSTDGEGFIGNLDATAPGWDSGLAEAVVVGAGGSARAIVHALLARDIECIHVVNRTLARAEALRDLLGPRVVPAGWEALPRLLQGGRLLVNTAALGSAGGSAGSVADGASGSASPIDLSGLSDNAVVADITYVPLHTDILRAATARGLRTVDGLGMLLHQAVRGFSLWFGVRPTVTPELRALVERDLGVG